MSCNIAYIMPLSNLFVDNFLKMIKYDRIRKEFNDLYEPLIKFIIDETEKVLWKDMQDEIDNRSASVTVLHYEISVQDDAVNKSKLKIMSLLVRLTTLAAS